MAYQQIIKFTLVLLLAFGAFFVGRFSIPERYEFGYNHAISDVAHCSLDNARADKCFIPCATDTDCLEKNGQTDH